MQSTQNFLRKRLLVLEIRPDVTLKSYSKKTGIDRTVFREKVHFSFARLRMMWQRNVLAAPHGGSPDAEFSGESFKSNPVLIKCRIRKLRPIKSKRLQRNLFVMTSPIQKLSAGYLQPSFSVAFRIESVLGVNKYHMWKTLFCAPSGLPCL